MFCTYTRMRLHLGTFADDSDASYDVIMQPSADRKPLRAYTTFSRHRPGFAPSLLAALRQKPAVTSLHMGKSDSYTRNFGYPCSDGRGLIEKESGQAAKQVQLI